MPDYTLAGLFLLSLMEPVPLFLIYALSARPNWTWAETLSRRSGQYRAWTGTLALGVLLAVWLVVQGLLIGFKWPIQYVTAVNGFLIILLALVPGTRRFYAKSAQTNSH